MSRVNWTDEKKQFLIDYMKRWVPGMPYPPRIDGVSPAKIGSELRFLGISIRHRDKQKWTEKELETLVGYIHRGLSVKDCANILRRSISGVEKAIELIDRYGYVQEELYAVYGKDTTIECVGNESEIAKYCGITEEEVKMIGKTEKKKTIPIYYVGCEIKGKREGNDHDQN